MFGLSDPQGVIFNDASKHLAEMNVEYAQKRFKEITNTSKFYPRAQFNLFSICCNGMLKKFKIDEGIEHLKEAAKYKHSLGDLFYNTIKHCNRNDLGYYAINEAVVLTRHQTAEIKYCIKGGLLDPYTIAVLSRYFEVANENEDCSTLLLGYILAMKCHYYDPIMGEAPKKLPFYPKPTDYGGILILFNQFIYFPLIKQGAFAEFKPTHIMYQYALALYTFLYSIESIFSREVANRYIDVILEYVRSKDRLFGDNSIIDKLKEESPTNDVPQKTEPKSTVPEIIYPSEKKVGKQPVSKILKELINQKNNQSNRLSQKNIELDKEKSASNNNSISSVDYNSSTSNVATAAKKISTPTQKYDSSLLSELNGNFLKQKELNNLFNDDLNTQGSKEDNLKKENTKESNYPSQSIDVSDNYETRKEHFKKFINGEEENADLSPEVKALYTIISDYGIESIGKILACYVITPFIQELNQQNSVFVEYAVEKFLCDQFDGIRIALSQNPSKTLHSFYDESLEKISPLFEGALIDEVGFGIDNFINDPYGPSQRVLEIGMSLQRLTNDIFFSADISVNITKVIFELFKFGLFLPIGNYVNTDPLVEDYNAEGIGMLPKSTLAKGRYFGYMVKDSGDEIKLEQRSDYQKQFEALEPILRQLKDILRLS